MAHRTSSILLTLLAVIPIRAAAAQAPLEPADAALSVLPTSLYNDQANLREASDSSKSSLGTTVLRSQLNSVLAGQVRPFIETDSLAAAPFAMDIAGGLPCGVKVACALAVARAQGARWAVLSKVSKTSNLIWLLSAQLVRVVDGQIVLDDSTELKGQPEVMIPIGMRIFADRVARTIRAGGITTNFPS
jgi:hypothetical protein